jgi:hypothetical protein
MNSTPMSAIIEHAAEIAGPLSDSLAELEAPASAVAFDAARRAVHEAWLTVVDDFENSSAEISRAYLANVHARLANAAGLEDSGGFAEYGLPFLEDGRRESWGRFVRECRFDEEDGAEEEHVLAQLRWGEHVRVFAIALGWIAMNIVRMRRGQHAVYPPPEDHARLLRFLEYAGPDNYDAEAGLRGLAEQYARTQT